MSNLAGFSVKSNKMYAELYILNMIVGSYYADTYHNNFFNKIKMEYLLMNAADQVREEERLLQKLSKLDADRLEYMQDLKYVPILKAADNRIYVWFRTGFEEIICCVDANGKLEEFQTVDEFSEKEFQEYIREKVAARRKKAEEERQKAEEREKREAERLQKAKKRKEARQY